MNLDGVGSDLVEIDEVNRFAALQTGLAGKHQLRETRCVAGCEVTSVSRELAPESNAKNSLPASLMCLKGLDGAYLTDHRPGS